MKVAMPQPSPLRGEGAGLRSSGVLREPPKQATTRTPPSPLAPKTRIIAHPTQPTRPRPCRARKFMSALIERKSSDRNSIAIETTDAPHFAATKRRLTAAQRQWLGAFGFEAAPGTFAMLPDENGKLVRVLVGVDASDALGALGALPRTLPEGTYHLADEGVLKDKLQAALGWAFGAYEFTRYRKARRAPAKLAIAAADFATLKPLVEATSLVRDLVNTPTEDMGPKHLADAVKQLGKTHKAKVREWVGDELLDANFPTIHAVGRASHRSP